LNIYIRREPKEQKKRIKRTKEENQKNIREQKNRRESKEETVENTNEIRGWQGDIYAPRIEMGPDLDELSKAGPPFIYSFSSFPSMF
jgi:hypothetical protein